MSNQNEENATLEMICKIEENYKENFKAQAKFLKNITEKALEKNSLPQDLYPNANNDPFTFILDFLGRGDEGRRKIAEDIMGKNTWEKVAKNILFLGIQNLTRTKRQHLDRTCDKNKQEIQKCLKNIFWENDKLKEKPNFKKLKDVFKTPTSTVTSVLYWLYPEQYIPFDEYSKRMYKKLGSDIDSNTWEVYGKVLSDLKEKKNFQDQNDKNKFNPSMIIALSYASWIKGNHVADILYKLSNENQNKPKNIILTGIPGTGKTHTIRKFLKNKYDKDQYEFVQFHPSYDYEDFIEGLKPIPAENGQIAFKLVDGVFKKLCKKAYDNKGKTYVMVIDEINRANLSRVFGELLYCLEYRDEFVSTKMTTYIESLDKKEDKEKHSIDPNNIGKFAIPSNLIILGTMNEVDRSIDAFDLALRRRFIWKEIGFDESALRLYEQFFEKGFQAHIEELIKRAKELNKKLSDEIGANYQIGHTYYFKVIDYFDKDINPALCDLWEYHLESIVREYCKVKFGEDELKNKLQEYKKIIVEK